MHLRSGNEIIIGKRLLWHGRVSRNWRFFRNIRNESVGDAINTVQLSIFVAETEPLARSIPLNCAKKTDSNGNSGIKIRSRKRQVGKHAGMTSTPDSVCSAIAIGR